MSHWKVVASAVTFGKYFPAMIQRLEEADCEVILNPFGRPFTNEEMLAYARDADALIVGTDKVPKAVIEQFHQMKIIAKHGVGVDAIDKDQAAKMGIIVTNAPGTNKSEVADCAMGFLLMMARNFYQTVSETKQHLWLKRPGKSFVNKTVGVIGIGNIGTEFVKRAAGFGLRILGYDLVEREEAKHYGVRYVDLDTLIKDSDFISLHVPLNEQSYHILGEKQFSIMKKGMIIANTARSKCIDQTALTKALQDGTCAFYATDVYDSEPPIWQPYFDFPNVLLTPHEAGTTYDSNERMGHTAVDNVLAVKKGVKPPNLVNERGASK